MSLRDRLRDLHQHGQRRRVVAAPELQPGKSTEHGEIEPSERQRLGASLHGLVHAP